ncbi:MurR/RpiR family transcriptional regulator [Weizmannia acidilactici]|uniref:MurR/RpiR family transcriptional regulator n=1 Tax=Weizmannia acidilactici TaxID=2607726 RepID=UPI0020A59FAA|nr:MurR/RpiR family transcriptional regulator [Weizmannia acidilactici]
MTALEESIILKIKSKLEELSKMERRLGEYILSHAEEIVDENTGSLAKKAGISPATVVRFCKSIGLQGFAQLKIKLYADVSGENGKIYTDISPNEDVPLIAEELAIRFNQSISQTANKLDAEAVDQVAGMLDACPVIYVYGLGASHVAAEDFTQKFSRIGKAVVHMQDHHLLASSLANADQNSLFIAVSNSGETIETVKLMKIAKQRGLRTVAITQKQDSTLTEMVDFAVFHHGGEAVMLRSAATTSLAAQLFTINVLYFAYVSKHYSEAVGRLKTSKSRIQTFFRKD